MRRHEEMHGRIARQMVFAAHKSISKLTRRSDHCVSAKRQVESIIDAVYAEYEHRQTRFDDREHGHGGNVDRLMDMLTRE